MDKKNRPDYKAAAYDRMAEDWQVCQAIYDGTRAVRDGGYLVKFDKESDTDYDNRVVESEFFNVLQSTLDSCVGMVFQNDITPRELPESVEDMFRDIDLAGNDLDMFLRQTFLNGIRDGHSYVFIDAPPAAERTLADDFRPYWVNYTADQILNWRFVVEAGRVRLQQVTIYECHIEPDGEYGEKEVDYYKVVRRGPEGGSASFVLYRKESDSDGTRFIEEAEGLMATREIPLVPFYAQKVRPYESNPPYLDLADTNLKHYNAQSRLRKALTYVIPVPVFKIDQKNDAQEFAKLTMASDRAVIMWGEHAEASYLELKGDSVPALERDIDKLEDRMARLGLEKFAPTNDASAKTAYEVGADNRREFSELAVMAKNLQNAVESAFDFTMEYLGLTAEGDIVLNIDYDRLTYSVEQLNFFAGLHQQGALSLRTLLRMLPELVPMPEDFDPEEEQQQIDNEKLSAFAPIAQTAADFEEL